MSKRVSKVMLAALVGTMGLAIAGCEKKEEPVKKAVGDGLQKAGEGLQKAGDATKKAGEDLKNK